MTTPLPAPAPTRDMPGDQPVWAQLPAEPAAPPAPRPLSCRPGWPIQRVSPRQTMTLGA